ncbi:hypothetical protein [Roseococcus pinisoli]|uniref:CopG family transcriptional regulator n=1 Tax=Roseococcus pinisoli TaxID=2835040 RepID=A0ABS5QHP3_9PROT|nr:hypothetical protein [Roseococcus pinisoli]MBS7812861.1 hypothetical protein [Roseococcus pinisoli]
MTPTQQKPLRVLSAAQPDAEGEQRYASLPAIVLPHDVVVAIRRFASERSMTSGQLLREGLRRVGALRLSEVDLGFAEPRPRRAAA